LSFLSVIVPVWNNKNEILSAHKRIDEVLFKLDLNYEIFFVDDGSEDGSFILLEELHRRDPRVSVLKLDRNYGQSPALAAGLENARGDILLTIDVDLDCDPVEIPRFLNKIDEGWELVSGFRTRRNAPLLSRRIPSFFMNQITSMITGVRLRDYGCGMNMLTRQLASRFSDHHDRCCFLKPLAVILSRKTTELKIVEGAITRFKSSYSTLKLLKLMIDMVVVFTINQRRQPMEPIYRVDTFLQSPISGM